jgi:acyl carrier protein
VAHITLGLSQAGRTALGTTVTDVEIEELILRAVRNMNLARNANAQVVVSSTAPLFGADSPLDSLGLVSLLMDVEEDLAGRGFEITLSDSRAMSQRLSPFRSVPALVSYIREMIAADR